jgi:hypothetical protein
MYAILLGCPATGLLGTEVFAILRWTMNKECLVSTALTTNFTVSCARVRTSLRALAFVNAHNCMVKVTTTPKFHVMALRDAARHLGLVRRLLRSPFTSLPYIHPNTPDILADTTTPPLLAELLHTQPTTALLVQSAITTSHLYLTYIPLPTHFRLQPCLEATTPIRS